LIAANHRERAPSNYIHRVCVCGDFTEQCAEV
jgi:hypothetical protein